MVLIGSIGLGLVWGWLAYLVGRVSLEKRPYFTGLILSLATLLPAIQMSNQGNLPAFLITTLVAFTLHYAWLNTLKQNQKARLNNQ